jgi:hypothetical protein
MGMTEYDGERFGQIKEFEEAFKDFRKELEENPSVSGFHCGSFVDLEKKKAEVPLKKKVAELEEKLEALQGGPKSDIIHLPTAEELKKLLPK